MKFECHITLSVKDEKVAQEVATLRNWKTSKIIRDPDLGDDTYLYLSMHADNLREIMFKMEGCSDHLMNRGATVIRQKIECIIHDTKDAK